MDNNLLSPDNNPQQPQHQNVVAQPTNFMDSIRPMPDMPEPLQTENTADSETMPSSSVDPIAVVRVLSSRGVEYVFLIFALIVASISLGAVLISLINGHTDFSVLAYPTAALIVSLPVFALLFLRLKKAENLNPALASDPSKRRSTQFIQIYAYIICLFTLIGIVSQVFTKMSSSNYGSLSKLMLDALVILVIAGGILSYYWRDEHRIK